MTEIKDLIAKAEKVNKDGFVFSYVLTTKESMLVTNYLMKKYKINKSIKFRFLLFIYKILWWVK